MRWCRNSWTWNWTRHISQSSLRYERWWRMNLKIIQSSNPDCVLHMHTLQPTIFISTLLVREFNEKHEIRKKRNIKYFMNITIATQKMKKNRRMCSQLQPSNISSDLTPSAVCLKPRVFSRRFPNCNSTENTKYGLNSFTHTAFYESRLCYA